MFYGLGSDGTVGANKNTVKILGAIEDTYAQGYYVYDSKKSGSRTVSHLRFGPNPIEAPYLISKAGFIGCHHWSILERVDVLRVRPPRHGAAAEHPVRAGGGVRPPAVADAAADHRPRHRAVVDRRQPGRPQGGHGRRTNTVLQTCFFAISNVLPRAAAIEEVKRTIRKTYGRKGEDVVAKNEAAVDASVDT